MTQHRIVPVLETDEDDALVSIVQPVPAKHANPDLTLEHQVHVATNIKFLADSPAKPPNSSGTTTCPHCGSEMIWESAKRSLYFKCAKPGCCEFHVNGGVSKPERKIPVQKPDDMFNLGSVPDEW
jgi:hypothetical protein